MPPLRSHSLVAPALVGVLFGALLVGCGPENSSSPWTDGALRPERTDYRETTSHAEVLELLEEAAQDPRMHLATFGYSLEGRPLPLLVVGPVEGASPDEARATPRLRVYVQGNIHAGEVAGKEALLRLIRSLLEGERPEWTREMVLLIAPVYNADGNERLSLTNRLRQHGPVGGMGTRANAQGLDLNRDQMKLDSPEARSLARLLTEYDPHVVIDLHTTNGTRHAYHLTYSPPLHPATPEAVDALLRDELLPRVTAAIEERYGWHFWHYGNVSNRDGSPAWYTFDHRPRFVTNYAGLRNRVGILSEAYSYATFHERILASERFVEGILEFLFEERERVRTLVEDEAARDLRGTTLPVRAGFGSGAEEVEILMGDVVEEPHPFTGAPILRRLEVVNPERMRAFIAFEGTESETVPAAYFLPEELAPVVERLRAHGIRVDRASGEIPRGAEGFRVRELRRAEEGFQGRHEVAVTGEWNSLVDVAPHAAYRVDMDQPLARLAFLLLEPRADDGFLNWGILDPWLEEGALYPVLREAAR